MHRPQPHRILLASLPLLGTLLAAGAASRGWQPLLTAAALLLTFAAAGTLYQLAGPPSTSEGLSLRRPAASPAANPKADPKADPRPDPKSDPRSDSAAAAAIDDPAPPPALESPGAGTQPPSGPTLEEVQAPAAPEPPPAAGTRAEALASGHWRETDLLTGLLNPQVFAARGIAALERCRQAGQSAVLVLCDLDGFTAINRDEGLAEANHLLRRVAAWLRVKVREQDVVGRLGGDEFGLFFPGLPSEIAAERVRELQAAVREAGLEVLDESSPRVTACLGLGSFPEDGGDWEALLRAAESSLEAAKLERQAGGQGLRAPLLVGRS